ncbi:unnamed protein product [Mortierella alpina]
MPILASSKRRSTHRSFLSHFVLWSCSCCVVLLAVSNVAFAQADTSTLVSPPPIQQQGAKANAPAAPPPPPPGTAINHRPFIPGVIDMNAIAPFFPSKSTSCQLCKVQFPKLVECNLVANRTLSLIPRFGEFNHVSYVNGERHGGEGRGGGGLVHKKRSGTEETSPFLTVSKLLSSSDSSSSSSVSPSNFDPNSVNFTAVMPFLQCICPDQRLEATRSCLTCFRVSNQRNFLNDLSVQNVASSLSAFAQACVDSNNGTVVPPGSTKGSSASESELAHGSHSATDSSSRRLFQDLNWTLLSTIMIIAVDLGYSL